MPDFAALSNDSSTALKPFLESARKRAAPCVLLLRAAPEDAFALSDAIRDAKRRFASAPLP